MNLANFARSSSRIAQPRFPSGVTELDHHASRRITLLSQELDLPINKLESEPLGGDQDRCENRRRRPDFLLGSSGATASRPRCKSPLEDFGCLEHSYRLQKGFRWFECQLQDPLPLLPVQLSQIG